MLEMTFSDVLASIIAAQRIFGIGIACFRAYQRRGMNMNDTFGLPALQAELTQDEGKRNRIYVDTKGKVSAGIGRNLSDVGVSDDEVSLMFANDIGKVIVDLDEYVPWWRSLDPVRQRVLINLCFNMGWGGLSEFHQFMSAMKAKNWNTAVAQLKASLWWSEVGERGPRIVNAILTGERTVPGFPAATGTPSGSSMEGMA